MALTTVHMALTTNMSRCARSDVVNVSRHGKDSRIPKTLEHVSTDLEEQCLPSGTRIRSALHKWLTMRV